MIVPLSSPENPDLTAWATRCNGCGVQCPAGRTPRDWLISDDVLDVHFCPVCVRILAAALIASVFGET
jgi:hypothetical protein